MPVLENCKRGAYANYMIDVVHLRVINRQHKATDSVQIEHALLGSHHNQFDTDNPSQCV